MSGRRCRTIIASFEKVMGRPAHRGGWDKAGRYYPSEVRRLKKSAKRHKWLRLLHANDAL